MSFIIKCLFRIFPFIYMSGIWLQSANFNPSSVEYVFDGMDIRLFLLIGGTLELAHLIEFGILYVLLIAALLTFGPLTNKKEVFAIIIAIIYSFTDEIHQYFVPYRSFSIIDIVKNVVGIWFFWWFIKRTYYKSNSKIGSLFRRIPSKREKESFTYLNTK